MAAFNKSDMRKRGSTIKESRTRSTDSTGSDWKVHYLVTQLWFIIMIYYWVTCCTLAAIWVIVISANKHPLSGRGTALVYNQMNNKWELKVNSSVLMLAWLWWLKFPRFIQTANVKEKMDWFMSAEKLKAGDAQRNVKLWRKKKETLKFDFYLQTSRESSI